jgi:hypothetical protein
LTLNHVITKRLAANLGLNYQNNYYKQGGVIDTYNENIISIGLGLSFKINRFASLTGGYAYTVDLAPASTGRNYNRSIAFLGANFSF